MQTHNSTASTKQEKVTWSPQFHGACSSSNIPRRFLRPSRVQANFSPQRNLIRLPGKKSNANPITVNSYPWCIAVPMQSTKRDLQKAIRIARQYWRTSTLREALAQPWSIAICTNWIESKTIRAANMASLWPVGLGISSLRSTWGRGWPWSELGNKKIYMENHGKP